MAFLLPFLVSDEKGDSFVWRTAPYITLGVSRRMDLPLTAAEQWIGFFVDSGSGGFRWTSPPVRSFQEALKLVEDRVLMRPELRKLVLPSRMARLSGPDVV